MGGRAANGVSRMSRSADVSSLITRAAGMATTFLRSWLSAHSVTPGFTIAPTPPTPQAGSPQPIADTHPTPTTRSLLRCFLNLNFLPLWDSI